MLYQLLALPLSSFPTCKWQQVGYDRCRSNSMFLWRKIGLWACAAGLGALAAVAVVAIRERLPAPVPASPPPAAEPLRNLLERAEALLSAARAPDDRRKIKQAEALLGRARVDYSNDYRVYLALAKLEVEKSRIFSNSEPSLATQDPYLVKKLLDKALSLNPRSIESLVELARYHESREDWGASLAVNNKALELTKAPNLWLDNMKFEVQAGLCLIKLDRLAEAERRMLSLKDRAHAVDEMTIYMNSLEFLAVISRKRKEYKEAERFLLEAVNEAAGTESASCPYMALGNHYESLGQTDKWIKTAQHAADSYPRHFDRQFTTAQVYFQNSNYVMALKYMRRALALWPESEQYKEELAKIQAAAKLRPPAVEFKKALAHFDDHKFYRAMMHINRALASQQSARFKVVKGYLLLMQKKYKVAKALLRQARSAKQAAAGAAVGLGHLLIANKDYAGARRLLEQAARKDSLKAEGMNAKASPYAYLVHRMACIGMGWLLADQGKHQDAMAYFDRALASHDDNIFALLGKGNSLNAMGNQDAAQENFDRVLKIDPHNQYAMAELALVYFNRGKLDRAEELFKAAMERDADANYTCPYEGLGMVYLRAGKLKQAKDHFIKAIKINPDIEYKKFNGLARIMIREGKLDRARELLRKSVENYPYDDKAKKLLESIQEQPSGSRSDPLPGKPSG